MPQLPNTQAVLVSVVALVWLTVQLAAAAPEQLAAGEAAPLLSTDAQGRPGDHFSPTCGSQGMSVCSDACISVAEPGPNTDWCPKNLTSDGCQQGLTKVFVTPSSVLDQLLPSVCMAMPQVGVECGVAGKPCCLQPNAANPSTFVRPMCDTGLTCTIPDPVTTLPYGGLKHLLAVLKQPGSQGLLAAELMGTCRSTAPVHESEADAAGGQQPVDTAHGVNSVLGECGTGRLRCPNGTYCASNEDHLLGGARCVPMPANCGGPYQQCCPPYSNGEPGIPSIVDKRTAVPVCNDAGSVCAWKSKLGGFDPSSDNEAVQLLTPPGSASMAIQYPDTVCIPNMAKCGQAGQPCCPHAQFAISNDPMYFRLHVCDPGLRCSHTISMFKGGQPVLGVCQGEEHACGDLGQKCCTHIDQAGWEWRTCDDGRPGTFCGPNNVCTRCPSSNTEAGTSQATLAALSLPGVGNAC